MSFNIEDFGIITGHIFAVSGDPGNSGWYIAKLPDDLTPPEWDPLVTPDSGGRLRIIGQMVYKVVDGGDTFWVDGLLCNSSTVTDIDSFMVYIDPRNGAPAVKSWSNYYPTDEGGTADSMPRANRCTMWGDFLVLGDIVWNADDTQPLTQSNSTRFRHGLWFSVPGKTDTWDPTDTVFVGQKAGNNVVQGLFPLEQGLLVVTCSLVAMLQGTPDDFIYRELREGISNCGRNAVTRWDSKGGVLWVNAEGNVWFTNGESFQRLDETVKIENAISAAALGEYVFVSTPDITYVFRLYEEAGGWTRLVGPFGFSKMITTRRFLIGVEGKPLKGDFVLDSVTNGILDENTLWGEDRLITAFDFDDSMRGMFNGRALRSKIRTRPLPGFGHEVRFWHRFGVRAKGNGRILSAVSRPSSDPNVRGHQTRVNGRLKDRIDYVFDAHGPSIETTFDVQFEGDVTVEHMTVWEHGGRQER